MDTLNQALTWIAMHGYWFVLAGIIAVFCVRNPEKRRTLARVLLVFGSIIVGSIFLVAAYGKLKPLPGFGWSWASVRTSVALFAMQVESYQILSPAAANKLAHFLPFFELFLGVWLVSSIVRRWSALLASLVFCGFMIAIAYAYYHGLKIDCGCGVGPAEEAGPGALLRDGLRFLLPAVVVTVGSFWIRRKPATASVPQSTPAAQLESSQ